MLPGTKTGGHAMGQARCGTPDEFELYKSLEERLVYKMVFQPLSHVIGNWHTTEIGRGQRFASCSPGILIDYGTDGYTF